MKRIKDYFNNDVLKVLKRQEKAKEFIEKYIDNSIQEISLVDTIVISGCGMFSPQKRINFLEDKMRSAFSWKKIKASEEKGDYFDNHGRNFELKCSATNDGNTINILQIRLWQPVDYYRVIYFDLDEPKNSKSYILPKDVMEAEVKKYGSPTHGTKNVNKDSKHVEYSLHIPIKNEWDDLYLDQEFSMMLGVKINDDINIFTPLFGN